MNNISHWVPRRLVAMIAATLACAAWSAGAQAAADRPNILFIVFDDWGGDMLGTMHSSIGGSTWIKTPNFDRVAREGILFRNAFTSDPKCTTSRVSLVTGRNSWQNREGSVHGGLFPPGFEVYPDLLEQAGYAVGSSGKGAGGRPENMPGRTRDPAGPGFNSKRMQPPANLQIGLNDYPGNFEAFLKQRAPGQPFCFWMGFNQPHRGYDLGSGVRLGKKLEDVKVPSYFPDSAVVRSDMLDYAIEVEWGDMQIGRTLEILEAHGELDNTVIVITSDHGMPFPRVKGQIFNDAFHVPMAVRWGATVRPGRVVQDFINFRDFAPTFMELAGLEPHPQMTGRSFAAILRSERSGWIERRREMLVGKERHDIGRPDDMGYPVRGLRTPEYLYVYNFFPDRWPAGNPETDFPNCDGSPTKEAIKFLGGYYYELSFGKRPREMLFRLSDDPDCVRNLASDLAFRPTVEEMHARMIQLLREDEDPRILGHGEVFDTYRYLGLRWRGTKPKGYPEWLEIQKSALEEAIGAKKR